MFPCRCTEAVERQPDSARRAMGQQEDEAGPLSTAAAVRTGRTGGSKLMIVIDLEFQRFDSES